VCEFSVELAEFVGLAVLGGLFGGLFGELLLLEVHAVEELQFAVDGAGVFQ
jgi:hypothetical protein